MPSSACSGISGIDTHAHIFRRDLPLASGRRYSPDYDASVEQFLAQLDRCGLSQGVLIQPSFLGTDNRFMLEALRRYPERLRGVAVVSPDIDDAELDELGAAGVVGVRLNLIGQPLEDYQVPRWQEFFKRLAQRSWHVEVQRGFDDLAYVIRPMIDAGVNVVVDHFGLPRGGIDMNNAAHRAALALLGQAPVWVKLSAAYRSESDLAQAAVVLAQLRQACGGVGRFLWGSDWPHTQFEERTDHAAQFAFLERLLPDPAERARVLVENPAELFGFLAR